MRGPGLSVIDVDGGRVVETSLGFEMITGSSGNRCFSLRNRFISLPYRKQNLRIVAADTWIPLPFKVAAIFS